MQRTWTIRARTVLLAIVGGAIIGVAFVATQSQHENFSFSTMADNADDVPRAAAQQKRQQQPQQEKRLELDPTARTALISGISRAIHDPHPDVRIAAIRAAAQLEPSVRIVDSLLRETHSQKNLAVAEWQRRAVAAATAETLAGFGAAAVPAFIDKLGDELVGADALEWARKYPTVAVPALITALTPLPSENSDSDSGTDNDDADADEAAAAAAGADARFLAAWALGKFGADAAAAVPALTNALTDSDVRVIDMAAWALGEIGLPAAAPAVSALIPLMMADRAATVSSVQLSATVALARLAPDHPAVVVHLPAVTAAVLTTAIISDANGDDDNGAAANGGTVSPDAMFLVRAAATFPAPAAALIAPIILRDMQISRNKTLYGALRETVIAMGPVVVPAIAYALLHGDEAWQTEMAEILVEIGPTSAFAAVAVFTRIIRESGESPTAWRTLASLGAVSPDDLKLFANANANASMREEIVWRLAQAAMRGADLQPVLPLLREWAIDETTPSAVVVAVLSALAAVETESATVFAPALQSADLAVQAAAIDALLTRGAEAEPYFSKMAAGIVALRRANRVDDAAPLIGRWRRWMADLGPRAVRAWVAWLCDDADNADDVALDAKRIAASELLVVVRETGLELAAVVEPAVVQALVSAEIDRLQAPSFAPATTAADRVKWEVAQVVLQAAGSAAVDAAPAVVAHLAAFLDSGNGRQIAVMIDTLTAIGPAAAATSAPALGTILDRAIIIDPGDDAPDWGELAPKAVRALGKLGPQAAEWGREKIVQIVQPEVIERGIISDGRDFFAAVVEGIFGLDATRAAILAAQTAWALWDAGAEADAIALVEALRDFALDHPHLDDTTAEMAMAEVVGTMIGDDTIAHDQRLAAATFLLEARAGHTAAIPNLICALTANEAQIRELAVELLAELGTAAAGAVEPIVRCATEHDSPALRRLAAQACFAIGPASVAVLPTLRTWTADGDDSVAIYAIRAIGAIGPPTATVAMSDLLARLKDGNRTSAAVQSAAVTAMAAISPNSPALKEIIRETMRAEDRYLRQAAITAAGRLDGADAVRLAQMGLHDVEVDNRVAALLVAGTHSAEAGPWTLTISMLVHDHSEPTAYRVRLEAVKTLGAMAEAMR